MESPDTFDLFVFHRSVAEDKPCLQGGARGIVVDFEMRGKERRQHGYDTQINLHTLDDLRQVKQELGAYTICRVNPYDPQNQDEIRAAIAAGADEILVPMIRSLEEVEGILDAIAGKCQVGLMIETEEAVRFADRLNPLPLSRLYLGLNDLHICRKSSSIFEAIYDGTVENVRAQIQNIPFGFGGLTLPGHGSPLPVEHLVHEMARLQCQFTFLRRSFFKDTQNHQPQQEIPRILQAIDAAYQRSTTATQSDQAACWQALEPLVEAKSVNRENITLMDTIERVRNENS